MEPAGDDALERKASIAMHSRVLDEVLAEIGEKHPRARQLVELWAQGIDKPADQAKHLGCSVRDVELTMKAIKYRAGPALEGQRAIEDERMQKLRRSHQKREVTS